MKYILDNFLAIFYFIIPHCLTFFGLLISFCLAVIFIKFLSNRKRRNKKNGCN